MVLSIILEVIILNTLVIGNGFDLAHGLPTQYKDFMNFFQFCEILIENAHGGNKLGDIQNKYFLKWGKFSDKMKEYITDVYADCNDIGDINPDFI